MARPERNTVDYFPFLCDEGKKMFYIEETYGNDGFAVFIKILRELAKSEYHYLNLSEKTTQMFLAAKCKVSQETLISIINDLTELGKFDNMLWHENKIIWCQDFIDSIQDAYSRRNNNCITYDGLLTHLTSLGIRKPVKSKSNGSKNPQSKVEYNKVEYNKEEAKPKKGFTPPSIDEVKKYCQERKNKVDPDRFINFYESKGWMVGKNKMKSWQAAVRNWEKTEKDGRADKKNDSKRSNVEQDYSTKDYSGGF